MVSGNFKNKKKRAGGKEDLKIRKSKESLSQKLPLLYFSRKQRSANNKKHELNLTRSLELFFKGNNAIQCLPGKKFPMYAKTVARNLKKI